MNINASNHSLPNIITRTLMGKREKRPTFEEVYKTLSKNSAKMNARMPLNSSLTNEQMFRCYVQNTIPKLQKSNDTFGETELNTVLMKLLGNDPNGNALAPTPLTTPPIGIPTGITPPPPPALPTASTASLTAPTAPTTAPTAPTASLTAPTAPTASLTAPTASLTAPTTGLTPLLIPPPGLAPPPAPSPILAAASSLGATVGGALMNMAATFSSPSAPIAGLPTTTPVSPAPVLPATNLAAAFTSVATPTPEAMELARQFVATQALSEFNVAGLRQVISVRGAPLKPTKDPLEMEISAGNQLLNKIRTRKIDPNDLTGDLKINYDRALQLKRQVAQKLAATKARKEAASESKKEKDARRDSSLSQATTVAGSPNPETKAQKQARIKADKEAAKAAAPPSTETPFDRKIRLIAEKAQKTVDKIIKSAPIGAAKTAAKAKAKKDAIAIALAAI